MGWGLVHRMAEGAGTCWQEGAPLKAWRTTTATMAALATAFGSLLRGNQRRARVELGPGDIAPDFSLAASDGRTYRLADFRGRSTVVIAWFPKAFTSGCTAECTSIRLTRDALGALDATIFAASCDTVGTNRSF